MTVVRFVDVESGTEVSRVELDAGEPRYSGGETARGVVEQLMRTDGLTAADAVARLAADGWSNGYIRVAL